MNNSDRAGILAAILIIDSSISKVNKELIESMNELKQLAEKQSDLKKTIKYLLVSKKFLNVQVLSELGF